MALSRFTAATLLAGLAACTAPPPEAYIASTTPVPATTARSPGNAALALRTAALFEAMCTDLDLEKARGVAQRFGFNRADATEARVFLGQNPGEVWVKGGYDVYVLTWRALPAPMCDLGVHLAEAAQIEPSFARLMGVLRDKGYGIGPAVRQPTAVAYRAERAPERARFFLLIAQPNPRNAIRSVLRAQAI
jgi:hypothetical protein